MLRPLSALAAALVLSLAAVPGAQAQRPDPLKVPDLFRDCGSQATTTPRVPADPKGTNPSSPNPLAGDSFFIDPSEQSVKDFAAYQRAGRRADAQAIAKLAFRPKARWLGAYTRPNMPQKVRNYLNCVQVFQPGATPLLTVLRHQGKQCNSRYQAGGVAEDNATKAWYRDLAGAIGNQRVVIAFEPDSVGTIECLARSRRQARKDLLRYGVDVLSTLPNATIYLEGTASDWKSVRYTAAILRHMGIAKVRGFMLNVTHYDWTSKNIAYGRRVSRLVGGKPFVVSTSYNGRGPVHYMKGRRRINVFCNPRYRGLGPAPTTRTGFDKVDAFLWLNRPGLSGAGACNGGPLPVGSWWPARALMFSRYATDWVSPRNASKLGLARRVSLCRLGAPLAGGKYSTVAPEKRCR
jgi:endoglucanase